MINLHILDHRRQLFITTLDKNRWDPPQSDAESFYGAPVSVPVCATDMRSWWGSTAFIDTLLGLIVRPELSLEVSKRRQYPFIVDGIGPFGAVKVSDRDMHQQAAERSRVEGACIIQNGEISHFNIPSWVPGTGPPTRPATSTGYDPLPACSPSNLWKGCGDGFRPCGMEWRYLSSSAPSVRIFK